MIDRILGKGGVLPGFPFSGAHSRHLSHPLTRSQGNDARAGHGNGTSEFDGRAGRRLYREQLHDGYCRVDQLFAVLLLVEWLSAIGFALLVSPYTWAGETARVHIHVWTAIVLGAAIISLPVALVWIRPGAMLTRHAVASSQMLMSALLIHLSGGRIETHFHIFGSLAFLALS